MLLGINKRGRGGGSRARGTVAPARAGAPGGPAPGTSLALRQESCVTGEKGQFGPGKTLMGWAEGLAGRGGGGVGGGRRGGGS